MHVNVTKFGHTHFELVCIFTDCPSFSSLREPLCWPGVCGCGLQEGVPIAGGGIPPDRVRRRKNGGSYQGVCGRTATGHE